MKNILSALMTISAIAIIVIAGYYFRSRQEAPVSQTTETAGLPAASGTSSETAQSPGQAGQDGTVSQLLGQQTTQAAPKLVLIAQNQALDYFSDKGSNVFMIQPDGRVVRVSGGKGEVISSGPVANVIHASFSFDGKRIMAITSSSSGNKFQVFNIDDKTWKAFSSIIQSASWSPDSHKIAFLTTGDSSALYTIDTDNASAKPVEIMRVRQEDMNLSWVSASRLLLSDSPSAFWNSSVWSVDVARKTIVPVISAPGLETAWSSSTLASVGIAMSANSNGQGGRLKLIDQNGKEAQAFSFLTLPSKCAFYDKPIQSAGPTTSPTSTAAAKAPAAPKANLTMVCGIPRDFQLLDGSQLPDSYLKKSLFTSDNFFEIDIATGNAKSVFEDSAKNIDSYDLKISGQSLFFINRFDQKVYSVALPK